MCANTIRAYSIRSEEEFDVGYVYGPEATNQDITARSLLPLLRKFMEGYNTTVITFGATGTAEGDCAQQYMWVWKPLTSFFA